MTTRTEPSLRSASMPGGATSKAGPSPGGQAVVVLNVPFAEKDAAKALGARWDQTRKKWYVPRGVDSHPFRQWMPDAGQEER